MKFMEKRGIIINNSDKEIKKRYMYEITVTLQRSTFLGS